MKQMGPCQFTNLRVTLVRGFPWICTEDLGVGSLLLLRPKGSHQAENRGRWRGQKVVKGAPGIISPSLESQQMHRSAKTPQRCTEVCHILLKTTAHVLRQNVIKKSEGWSLSSFSFPFVLFVFSAREPHIGPILFIGKWLVNSAFCINSLRAQEHSCELHQPSPGWGGHQPSQHIQK